MVNYICSPFIMHVRCILSLTVVVFVQIIQVTGSQVCSGSQVTCVYLLEIRDNPIRRGIC